jgi:hypothetical protein
VVGGHRAGEEGLSFCQYDGHYADDDAIQEPCLGECARQGPAAGDEGVLSLAALTIASWTCRTSPFTKVMSAPGIFGRSLVVKTKAGRFFLPPLRMLEQTGVPQYRPGQGWLAR